MQLLAEYLRVSFALLLELDDILCQRVITDFEGHSRAFRIFNQSQVARLLRLRKQKHVRDTKLSGNTYEILQSVLLRLLQF